MKPTTVSRSLAGGLTAAVLGLILIANGGQRAETKIEAAARPAVDSTTSTTDPNSIYFVEHPTVTDWLAISIDMPSSVTAGETFTISGTCQPGFEGEFAGAIPYLSPDPNPANGRVQPASAFGTQSMVTQVQTGSVFTVILTAPAAGTFYFQVSCLPEAWGGDTLRTDPNGRTYVDYYYFPVDQMRTLVVTAPSPAGSSTTAAQIPPTR